MSNSYPMAMVETAGQITWVQHEIPPLSADHVLIKTKAVSICGSDLHTFKGKHPFAPLPAALGHELAGEVVELGSGVTKLAVGDRVALEPVIICGRCQFCRQGDYNLCQDISFHHRKGQGAFTPFFAAHENWVHKLPDNISYEEGALLEPMAVAVHAVNRADIQLGESVAVLGAGSIGLMIMKLCIARGAGQVFVVDLRDSSLAKAVEMGATAGINAAKQDPAETIAQATGGLGVEVAFEAVGIQPTLLQALSVLKKGGRAVLAGLYSSPEVSIPSNIFVSKEISVSGTQGYCWDFQTSIKLLANKRFDLKPFITHIFGSDGVADGFALLSDPENQAVKVVIQYP